MNAVQEEWEKMKIAYQIRYARMYKKVKGNEFNTDNHGALLEMSYVLITVFGLTAKQIQEIERNDGLTNKDIDECACIKEPNQLVKLKLPCEVGDTIYAITFDGEKEQYVITESKIATVTQNCNDRFVETLIYGPAFGIKDFGKRIFFTRVEAEAKLAELRGREK